MKTTHPEQIICLLLWISAGTQHMAQCQQLLVDGTREWAGKMARAGGMEPCCPCTLCPAAGLGSRAGLMGRDPLVLPVGPPRSPSVTGAPPRLEPGSSKPHMAERGWSCWITEAMGGRKPLLSPLCSQVSPGSIPAMRCVCLGRGTRSNQMGGANKLPESSAGSSCFLCVSIAKCQKKSVSGIISERVISVFQLLSYIRNI